MSHDKAYSRPRRGRRRRDDDYDYYESSDYYSDDDVPPRAASRGRSRGREALDRLGAAMGLRQSRSRARSVDRSRYRRSPSPGYYSPEPRSRRRYHSPSSSSRSRRHSYYDKKQPEKSRWAHGVEAAIEAGAIEALRMRKEPGSWTGRKGRRVMTAAMGAAVINAAADARHGHGGHGHGKMGVLGSSVGGFVFNRLLNGPRR